MNYKPTILTTGQHLVARENLLFCLCPNCANEVNWRHFDVASELTAECCLLAIRARPTNNHLAIYFVEVKPANQTNVAGLFRRSFPLVEPPPKRYG